MTAMADECDKAKEDRSLFVSARRDIPSSSSSESSNFSLNDLPHFLIEEILLRLPTFKSAFLCKSVCKNWYSLISTPYFAHRFIAHHTNHQYVQNPYALIVACNDELFIISDEPSFKSRGFDLNYLPNDCGPITVAATYKDLMLCTDINHGRYGIFRGWVCNPFTKQWFTLPSCEIDRGFGLENIGFVCDPYYFQNSRGEYSFNCSYRFRVILMTEDCGIHYIWTYCSETQRWSELVFLDDKYGWCSSRVVAYNGKLLWYNRSSIFAYDPFNRELSTFIDCSIIESPNLDSSSYCIIGVCGGFLRMMQLAVWDTRTCLIIWEIKNVTAGEWRLEDKVFLDTMVPESSLVNEIVDSDSSLQLLCFHPRDRDIVYLFSHFEALVISCNIRTRDLKIVDELSCKDSFYRFDISAHNVFHIELPLWPTPIPN